MTEFNECICGYNPATDTRKFSFEEFGSMDKILLVTAICDQCDTKFVFKPET